MNTPTIFNFDDSVIRVFADDINHPHFVAKDVAVALGYSNTNDAINRFCKGVVKRDPLLTAGGMQEIRVIEEPDVYRLIFGSQLESAKKFQDWVFEEVLPSIRKTGAYIPQEILDRIAELEAKVAAQPSRVPYFNSEHYLSICSEFWDAFDTIQEMHDLALNHVFEPGVIAVNINEVIAAAHIADIPLADSCSLKRALKYSASPKFVEASRTVSSQIRSNAAGMPRCVRCWIFREGETA